MTDKIKHVVRQETDKETVVEWWLTETSEDSVLVHSRVWGESERFVASFSSAGLHRFSFGKEIAPGFELDNNGQIKII